MGFFDFVKDGIEKMQKPSFKVGLQIKALKEGIRRLERDKESKEKIDHYKQKLRELQREYEQMKLDENRYDY